MGLIRSDGSLEDDFNPYIEAFIVYQSLVSAPQPICCTSEPTELGCGVWCSILRVVPSYKLRVFLFHPFSHRFLLTDTNKNQQLHHYFTTYARNTLCLPDFFLSILHYYITVPNYHRRSLLHYRSDQIEQTLISYDTISTSPPVLVLVLVASTWTTIKFNSYFLRADNNNNRSGFICQVLQFTTALSSSTIDFFGTIFPHPCPAYYY